MTKKIAVFSVFLLILMTSVLSNCFCAPSDYSNSVSIQKSHSCCPSNSDSHCNMHLANSCFEAKDESFDFIARVNQQSNVNENLIVSDSVSEIKFESVQFFQSILFFKPEVKLFLELQVLRI